MVIKSGNCFIHESLIILLLAVISSSCIEKAPESVSTEREGSSLKLSSKNITFLNQKNYSLSGQCSKRNKQMHINIGALKFDATCDGSNWELENLDLSSLTDGKIRVQIGAKFSLITKDTGSSGLTIDESIIVNRGNEQAYTLTGTCPEEGNVYGSIGGRGFSAYCGPWGNWTASAVDLSLLRDGSISVQAYHIDELNNQSSPKVAIITKFSGPTVSLDTPVCPVFDGAGTITGVCSHDGKDVILKGPFVGTPVRVTCAGGVFSASLDFITVGANYNTSITAQHEGKGLNISSVESMEISTTSALPTLAFEAGNLSNSSAAAFSSHEHPDGIGSSLAVGPTNDDLVITNCINGQDITLSGGVKSAYTSICFGGKAVFNDVLFDTASVDALDATAFLAADDPSITATQSMCTGQSIANSAITKRRVCTGYQLGTTHGDFASSANSNQLGDKNFPYYICSLDQLHNMRNDLEGYYSLINDIDMSDTSSGLYNQPWNTSLGWVPVGSATAPFNGSFHGNDHTLTGMFIDRPLENSVGLFGHVTSQEKDSTGNWKDLRQVKFQSPRVTGKDHVGSFVGERVSTDRLMAHNVEALDVIINGHDYVGGIIGSNIRTTGYINFHSPHHRVTGSVSGNDYVGGIAGYGAGAISYSYVEANIIGTGDYVGGIVGFNRGYWSRISYSYFKGSVIGNDRVGGIVGQQSQNYINNCFVDGSVVGNNSVGGVVGRSFQHSFHDNLVLASVTGSENIAGIIGYVSDSSVHRNIFAGVLGRGSALNYGGILGSGGTHYKAVGNLNYRFDDNFYELTTNIGSLVAGQGGNTNDILANGDVFDSTDVHGDTTANLQLEATFTNWDFTSVWEMTPGGGYPRLQCPSQWELANGGFGCSLWEANQAP